MKFTVHRSGGVTGCYMWDISDEHLNIAVFEIKSPNEDHRDCVNALNTLCLASDDDYSLGRLMEDIVYQAFQAGRRHQRKRNKRKSK